jgi:formate dehydrogenase maturation protein FdhE
LGVLWNAVKAEISDTRPGLKQGSKEYFKAVTKRFDEIIDKTQVVDSVFHRSQIMRSKDNLVKMSAAFMSEPIKDYNVLRSAAKNVKTSGTAKAWRMMLRALAVFALTRLATTAAQSIMDVTRDDEDEKKDAEGNIVGVRT